jgi:riboflavin kinase / FMN adenylyltransferase
MKVSSKESGLTIGKFDGVHAGHARLLREAIGIARERGWTPAALTFDPHPVCVLAPERAPRPLMPLERRCALMREMGIAEIFVLHFTAEIARLSPEEFVAQYVRERMRARAVVVGENFRFGHMQAGDPRTLAELGARYGFETRLIAPVKRRGVVVSTSGIRGLVEAGNVSRAGRLLERPYALSGEVVHGFGIGARQTVPTLNLRPPGEVTPANGVYITRTTDFDQKRRWNSVTNIGFRPTFGGQDLSIETFLLDPLEGPTPARICVEFLHRLREERKFENAEALKRQILNDVSRAQGFFRRLAKWRRGDRQAMPTLSN